MVIPTPVITAIVVVAVMAAMPGFEHNRLVDVHHGRKDVDRLRGFGAGSTEANDAHRSAGKSEELTHKDRFVTGKLFIDQ